MKAATSAPATLEERLPASETPRLPKRSRKSLLTGDILWSALKQSFVMLRPDIQWKNPVMFVVEVGAFLTVLFIVQALVGNAVTQNPTSYFVALAVWLFLTVLFANFATAVAEARGKAQAESLRRTRSYTVAYLLKGADIIEQVS